jgi:hypothetical protein
VDHATVSVTKGRRIRSNTHTHTYTQAVYPNTKKTTSPGTLAPPSWLLTSTSNSMGLRTLPLLSSSRLVSMLMLLNVVTILHYFQAQTHLYDAEASRYFTESSGTLKTHSAPSDDITNARLTVRPRHGRFRDDTTATAPLYGSTVSRDSFGNASPSSSSLSANWTFLLCEECLQVVQYAPRVEITKPVQTRSDERKFLSYFYLKEAGRHPFQGALDAQGRSGFQYDVTSLRRNPPSFVDSFPNLTAECLRRDNEYYALQRLRIHSPSPEQSTTATRLSQSSTPARILCVVYSSEPFHHKLQVINHSHTMLQFDTTL